MAFCGQVDSCYTKYMRTQELISIEDFLQKNITNKNAVFVFSTDIVAQSWADWCVINKAGGVKAVSLERFMAWDVFKGTFVSADKNDYTSIPTILRKFFVYDLIKRNEEKPFLKKIINPEYRQTAYSFSDWLCKNLPSLYLWKKRLTQNQAQYGALDDEDNDYLCIYNQYYEFLETNKFFEPSWIENIEFSDKEREFYIFYPEQLEDFADFEDIFGSCNNVTALIMGKNVPRPKTYFYSDSRKELRHTILRMIELVQSDKADWTEISLSVPDIELYRPYLEREFNLYNVPFVIRAGMSLTKYNAGRIFKEISECFKNDFDFDSMRNLLLDENLPWKKEISLTLKSKAGTEETVSEDFDLLREEFVREGNRMRCICSFEEKDSDGYKNVDIWERAFLQNYKEHRVLNKLYSLLKKDIKAFYSSECTSFAQVRVAWFQFKRDFLDESDFSNEANKILSRCITHLEEMASIEREYTLNMGLAIKNPFDFFIKELNSKVYSPNVDVNGLSVFSYKVSASAFFKYQFVLDASQNNIEIPSKRLSFLSSQKRSKLGLLDDDIKFNRTSVIARLYAKTVKGVQENFVHISCAENSFSGFAIPHSCLEVVKENRGDEDDFILNEKKWISRGAKEKIQLTESQIEMLKKWKAASISDTDNSEYSVCDELKQKIYEKLIDNQIKSIKEYVIPKYQRTIQNFSQNEELVAFCNNQIKKFEKSISNEEHFKITARGDLEKFFPCARKWLFTKVLRLKDDSLDTDLMKSYDMGNLHHKILENFMKLYVGKELPYYDEVSECFMGKEQNSETINAESYDITDNIMALLFGTQTEAGIIEKSIKSSENDFCDSPIVIKTLLIQKEKIGYTVLNFLKLLLLPYARKLDKSGIPKGMNGIGLCTVFAVENGFVALDDNFDWYGKIDCVVKSPDNRWIILDYKNSYASVPKTNQFQVSSEGILEDFQMAVYYKILKDGSNKEFAASYFYSINDCKNSVVFDNVDESEKAESFFDNVFKYSVDVTKEYLVLFNDTVMSFDFLPTTSKSFNERRNVNVYENCKSCSFKSVCRTTYSFANKQILKSENRKSSLIEG